MTCHLQESQTWSENAGVLPTHAVILPLAPHFPIQFHKEHGNTDAAWTVI